MIKNPVKIILALVALLPAAVMAGEGNSMVSELQRDWAVANYELQGDPQVTAFDSLI